MPPFQLVLCAALGGALGAASRFSISWFAQHHARLSGSSPFFATTIVNLLGCFAIGWLLGGTSLNSLQSLFASSSDASRSTEALKVFLVVGFLGGFTTFSAFGYEALLLLQESGFSRTALYILVQVVLGIGAVALGARMS